MAIEIYYVNSLKEIDLNCIYRIAFELDFYNIINAPCNKNLKIVTRLNFKIFIFIKNYLKRRLRIISMIIARFACI